MVLRSHLGYLICNCIPAPLRLVRRQFGKRELSRRSKVYEAVDFRSFWLRKSWLRQQKLAVIYQLLKLSLHDKFSYFFSIPHYEHRTFFIAQCFTLRATLSRYLLTGMVAEGGLLRKTSFLFHDPACLLFFLVVNNSQNWNTQQFHAVLARFLVWFIWWIHSSCTRWTKPGSWELLARSGKLQSEWIVPVLPFRSENGQNDKMSKFHFKHTDKQTVPCDSTAEEVLFKL